MDALSIRRRTAGWRNSFGGCVHCRGVVLRRRHRRTFHVDERMARCPRNRNSKILEGEVTQIPPSARAKLPAKLPQQPPQDQDDLEHDRPSNLSVRVGQLCAWLLEHPPSQLGRSCQRERSILSGFYSARERFGCRPQGIQHCPIAFFGSPK